MSSDLCIIKWEHSENEDQITMPRKKQKKRIVPITPTPLSEFLRKAYGESPKTLKVLEEETGIPDATISRILSGEAPDPKISQVGRLVVALGLSFWKVMAYAGITDEAPADPTEEAQLMAGIIVDEPELQSTMGNLIELGPRDRWAVLKYTELLKQSDQSDPRSPPESE